MKKRDSSITKDIDQKSLETRERLGVEVERVPPDFENLRNLHELEARSQGYKLIAGGDEAGRGPWAGPVCAAVVILPEKYRIPGLDDSKKLKPARRQELLVEIKKVAIAYGTGWATSTEIDRINILEATKLAFVRAISSLSVVPDFILFDFITLPGLSLPSKSFPKGESVSDSIAAASIIAKESRDSFMKDLDKEYPGYGFARHMGYGTAVHQKALKELGVSSVHRKSFKPIKNCL